MSTRTATCLALILALTLAAACSVDEEPGSTPPWTGPTGLTGSLVVSGSSTVEPISAEVARRFNRANPDVQITVDGPGTGDGFELFCSGLIDVNDASSKIKPEQIDKCEANGVDLVELHIGNDGVALLTGVTNTAVDCLSLADIYALVGPESQRIQRWSDAQPLATELGSTTRLPQAPLDVVGPGEESGTFTSFVELVIEHFNEERGQEATTRPDYQASADDNVILQGIQGSDTSLGWVGFAFAHEAQGVKVLEVDGGDGCVAPTPETIADDTYPISRPLYIYVNRARAADEPAVAAWVDSYLSDDGISAVSAVGYVEMADQALEATRERWAARTAGPE